MNISEVCGYINFWANKKNNAWFSVDELVNAVDFGQIALYNDIKPKYATSQWVKDALSPFRASYNFTTLVSGYIIVPDDDYLDLLDIQTYYQVSNRTLYHPVPLVNEDERAFRLNSQTNPVTSSNPIGEQTALKTFRLYPTAAYNGNVTYLKRPIKPVFGYTVISGRVIVYNPNTSTQLQWRESELNTIMIKALFSLGVNLSDGELTQFAQLKTSDNYVGVNRL